MKSARHQLDILSAYRELGSIGPPRPCAGRPTRTVRRVVERRDPAAGRSGHRGPRAPIPSAPCSPERVRATDGRISAKRLLPAARAAGYAGSARSLRRAVALAKAAWRIERRVYRPWQAVPGEHLAIDWGSEGELHVFCAVLVWSRVRFVRFAADESQATTLALLAECFETLGGVPGVVLADRMGCLKGGVVANVVVPAPGYLAFALHYGFRPDFCEAADPESKGVVEHLVGYAKADLRDPGRAVRRPRRGQRGRGRLVRRGQRRRPLRDIGGPGRAPRRRACPARPPALAAPGTGTHRGPHGRPAAHRPLRLGPLQRAWRASSAAGSSSSSRAPSSSCGPAGAEIARHRLVGPGEMSLLDAHYGRAGQRSRSGRSGPGRRPRSRSSAWARSRRRSCARPPPRARAGSRASSP